MRKLYEDHERQPRSAYTASDDQPEHGREEFALADEPYGPPERDLINKTPLQRNICDAIDAIGDELGSNFAAHDKIDAFVDSQPCAKASCLSNVLQQWIALKESQNIVVDDRRPSWDHRPVLKGLQRHSEPIYVLKHDYTEESLSLRNLEADDLLKAKTLEHIGRSLGYTVLLATTERFVNSGGDEVFADCVELRKVFDLEGRRLVTECLTGEQCFLQADAFEDGREPDDQKCEGYTESAGVKKDWYRNSVSNTTPACMTYGSPVVRSATDRKKAFV